MADAQPSWNPLRLLQTLAYFQVVPFVGSLDWLFPPPPLLAPALAATPMPGAINAPMLIFDFSQANAQAQQIWGTVDDVVMGGVSESRIQWLQGRALFAGVVSTANSGGFASVRTRNLAPPLDLSAYQGLELQVRGDGQRYKFLLRSSSGWDSLAYAYGFDTIASDPMVSEGETWQTLRIPFQDLRPVFRAKTVADAPAFAADRVSSLQLMLSKFEYDGDLNPHFQPGPFRLEVRSIGVYGAPSL